jgi:hypothetical protein
MPTDMVQSYTISHTGSVLQDNTGNSLVSRFENQTAPQRETEILDFECPKKFEHVEYVGRRDATRFVPRAVESITGSTGDDTVVSLTNDIQPIAGETEIVDQDYPVAVAVNVDTGTQYDVVDVDYAANEVTLGTDPADTETVKVYPIITEGTLKFQGVNQFDQVEGPVQEWTTPLYRFHDMKQNKRGTEVNLDGRIQWERYESMQVMVDSPRTVVWTDPDYPEGAYVSTFEQDVQIRR